MDSKKSKMKIMRFIFGTDLIYKLININKKTIIIQKL